LNGVCACFALLRRLDGVWTSLSVCARPAYRLRPSILPFRCRRFVSSAVCTRCGALREYTPVARGLRVRQRRNCRLRIIVLPPPPPRCCFFLARRPHACVYTRTCLASVRTCAWRVVLSLDAHCTHARGFRAARVCRVLASHHSGARSRQHARRHCCSWAVEGHFFALAWWSATRLSSPPTT